ncbi:hypothetical protein Y1Q_0023324 [Alligator mississippiensis]|uniref:Uncharacterized protein n=1 Tax=Alligator mississippiensis TaxID=8496 RepID=A0A151NP80_ALLMI|nr:hypothetical protein Y1Q_0023324 [Alligator mississippiensis]
MLRQAGADMDSFTMPLDEAFLMPPENLLTSTPIQLTPEGSKYLTYVKQGDLDRGKLTLFLSEQTLLEAGNPLETPMSYDPVIQEVSDNVYTQYRKSAKALLTKLIQHKDISSWDDRGGFVYKGMPVKGSNMLDLVRGTFQTHARSSKCLPKGWDIFMKAMAELNVPSSVMGNTMNHDHLEHLKASASDQETPTALPKKQKNCL